MIVKLLPILGIRFIDILGLSILMPLMPFFVKHFGAPDVVVGGLIGVYACEDASWERAIDRSTPKTLDVHLIAGNYPGLRDRES